MLELIDKSKTVYVVELRRFLLGLIIWKPDILNVIAGWFRAG